MQLSLQNNQATSQKFVIRKMISENIWTRDFLKSTQVSSKVSMSNSSHDNNTTNQH